MFARKMIFVAACVGLSLLPLSGRADVPPSTTPSDRAALLARIKSLEATVDQLRNQNQDLSRLLTERSRTLVDVLPKAQVIPFADPTRGAKPNWQEHPFNGATFYVVPLQSTKQGATIVPSK